MKKRILILFFIGILVIVSGCIKENEITREIKIGSYDKNDKEKTIQYKKIFTNQTNTQIVDEIEMIYIHAKTIEKEKKPNREQDFYIEFYNPSKGIGLVDSKIWFTKKGAIIEIRLGEDWETTEVKEIDESAANAIKTYINGKIKRKGN